jgi:hypothetical protein
MQSSWFSRSHAGRKVRWRWFSGARRPNRSSTTRSSSVARDHASGFSVGDGPQPAPYLRGFTQTSFLPFLEQTKFLIFTPAVKHALPALTLTSAEMMFCENVKS